MANLGTRQLKIEIDGTEYWTVVSNCTIEAADGDSDFVPFADAATGGAKDFILKFTAAQDLATGSLWRLMWDQAGTEVPVTVMPYGNAAPSAAEGHMTGTVVVSIPDGAILGGEANASATAVFTWEAEWKYKAKPVLVNA